MYITKPRNRPFYYIVFEQDGKKTSRSTKCKLKSDALKFLSEFGKHLEAQKIVRIVTLVEFEKEYLKYVGVNLAKSSCKNIKTSFNNFKLFVPDLQLRRINLRHVDKFLNETFYRSQSAASLYYKTLKAAFNKAVEWNYITENPFGKIKAPKVKEKLPTYINVAQLHEINMQVDKQFLRDFYITAFNTGMRAGEICSIRWNAIDLNERILTVKHTESFTTKSKKERIIPINNTLMLVFRRIFPKVISIQQNELVFWKVKGIQLNVDYVSKKFKKACRRLNLSESIHLHVLRHSFASNLAQSGIDLYVIKELLGHSSISVTQKYSHLKRSNLFDAVEKLNISNTN